MCYWNLDSAPHALCPGFLPLKPHCHPFVYLFDCDFKHALHFIVRQVLFNWLGIIGDFQFGMFQLLFSKCWDEKAVLHDTGQSPYILKDKHLQAVGDLKSQQWD
jgi:hypothetical protein